MSTHKLKGLKGSGYQASWKDPAGARRAKNFNDHILQDFLSKNMLFNPRFEEKLWIYYWQNLFKRYL
jgi:hypothetical protein